MIQLGSAGLSCCAPRHQRRQCPLTTIGIASFSAADSFSNALLANRLRENSSAIQAAQTLAERPSAAPAVQPPGRDDHRRSADGGRTGGDPFGP